MTITQPSIFDSATDTFELQFESFIERHPRVWNDIVRIVAQAKDRGERRVAMRWVFDSIRATVPRDGKPVALNNNWAKAATERLQRLRPDLAPMLKTRRRTAA